MGAGGSSISTADGQDGGDTDVDDNDEGDDIDASSDADGKAATPVRHPTTPRRGPSSPVLLVPDEESDDDITWAPSPKRAKTTPKAAGVASNIKEAPSDRKRRDVKFESLQDALLQHETLADKSRQAAEKAARAEQHDLLLRIEGMRSDAEDKRAREQRAWEEEQRKKEREYDEKKERERREYAEKKERERMEYEEKKERERQEYKEKREREQDDLAQERRARETELHAALLAKYCSK